MAGSFSLLKLVVNTGISFHRLASAHSGTVRESDSEVFPVVMAVCALLVSPLASVTVALTEKSNN